MSERIELQVNRSSIGETRVVSSAEPLLASGYIRLAVEHFALTANNITYAQFGDMLDYWNFFPADRTWGRVPAMGWARVLESDVADIEVGSRFYGWYPMSSTVDILATPTSGGFRDDGTHRAKQAGAYRNFSRTDLDGMYTSAADEHRHELLRGLFITGFLIDQFFAAQRYFGAQQSIVLSASSKTALGYASAARTAAEPSEIRLVGVTSARNLDFVSNIGAYDQVVTYEELDKIESIPSVIVDMAGSGSTVAALHAQLADLIRYSMVVGKSHHDSAPAHVTGGPQPAMFFAPTSMDGCLAEWGPVEYARRVKTGLSTFIDASKSWLTIQENHGAEAVEQAWHSLHAGSFEPSEGVIASLAVS